MTGPTASRPAAHERAPVHDLWRHRKPPDPTGLVCHVDPGSAGWEWTTFDVYELDRGQGVQRTGDDMERLVLVLEGRARIRLGDEDLGTLGSRRSVFDGPPPPVVLVEPGLPLALSADGPALVAVAAAPGGPVRRTAVISPEEVLVETRGSGSTARRIHHLLPPAATAGRLIAFEAFTPGGNWSSYPPHKHDTEDPPRESRLEELYYYRFAKPQGFAFARVYTPDRRIDEVMTPMDGDLVLVPEGYHPVGVPAGYDCWYLNVMAGPKRAWHFTIDPDHEWLMDWSPTAPRAAR